MQAGLALGQLIFKPQPRELQGRHLHSLKRAPAVRVAPGDPRLADLPHGGPTGCRTVLPRGRQAHMRPAAPPPTRACGHRAEHTRKARLSHSGHATADQCPIRLSPLPATPRGLGRRRTWPQVPADPFHHHRAARGGRLWAASTWAMSLRQVQAEPLPPPEAWRSLLSGVDRDLAESPE